MELKVFDGQDKSELSMVEVAHAILAHHGEAMAFVDLTNEIQQYLGKSDEEIRERLAQFYTDLNIDGSFISLGDNTWGLRAWYPFESIDEATVGENDEDEEDRPKKKRRKVNAFLADSNDDDDVIDYDNDDPEDEDLDDSDDDDNNDDDYDEENDDDNDLDDNIEDQLSELHDEDDDDDDDE
ncbi:DNA-directed RNA polymerase subunit delta [Limosilactobacillus panis]|uniref:DNA-directed RNA polymerase subunit delta n=1 Tax=Limosilactobacillus panis TaxID=47493 RepID=UPI001C94D284|nr:DNA-directed RNA polymerase subunit delta [Limosilactobacillus panis]QZN93350.1 DNA-directed RNA polymerase subunit delta [Limosilactobacillus panis]